MPSIAITLAMTFVVTPTEIGIYLSVAVALTLYRSTFDLSQRQLGVTRVLSEYESVSRTAWRLSLIGTALVLAVCGAVGAQYGSHYVIATLPLAGVPLVTGLATPKVLLLERHIGGWQKLLRRQAIGGGVSLLILLPLVPSLGIAAASLQTLVAEAIFCASLVGVRRPIRSVSPSEPLKAQHNPASTYVVNFAGWGQGQLERAVAAGAGNAAALGVYGLASTVARTMLDAISAGVATVYRARRAAIDAPSRALTQGTLKRAALTGMFIQLLLLLAIACDVTRLLPNSWAQIRDVLIILSASCTSICMATVLTSVLVCEGLAKALVPAQLIGLSLSLLVGLALFNSVLLAAWLAVFRDSVALAFRASLTYQSRLMDKESTILALSLTTLSTALVAASLYAL